MVLLFLLISCHLNFEVGTGVIIYESMIYRYTSGEGFSRMTVMASVFGVWTAAVLT